MWSPIPEFPAGPFDIGQGTLLPDEAIMRTGRVDVDYYTSPERFARESELIGHTWLNIADESDIPNSGDWIVRDLEFRSASVLINRAPDGSLRAFHNVCAHRGMRLVFDEAGNSRQFTCPYHAWTYAADGSLKSVPDEQGFPCLEKDKSGLRPVHVGAWEGFIFINLDREPSQSLEDFIAPVAERLRDLPIRHFTHQAVVRERLDANWKLLLEAQSESYHIRALHARTVSNMLSSGTNPFCHPIDWEGLGPHRRWSTAINPAFELSDDRPVQKFAFMTSAQVVSRADGAGMDQAIPSGFPFVDRDPADRSDLWASDNLVLFPNVQINAGANGCWMHRFIPVSENVTDWEARYYFTPPVSARQEFAQHYALAFNRDTLMEDNSSCSRQQRSLASGALDSIQFGQQESACRHSAAVIAAALDHLRSLATAAE